MSRTILLAAMLSSISLVACNSSSSTSTTTPATQPKHVLFFLGDGMGIATLTAARIYSVGEDGELTIDTLPETAFVKTYSNDSQVTDSAPSMSAYMTGVKMNNDVISMSTDTKAVSTNGKAGPCSADNGRAVPTLLELAEKAGWATGAITTTRVTHATPAATYSHICHRDLEEDIALQVTPGSTGFNPALGDGLEVLMGGGSSQFLPKGVTGGNRSDGLNLVNKFTDAGYQYVANKTQFDAIPSDTTKLLGLFTPSHMAYDLDRDGNKEPSLSEMTKKAIQVLGHNQKGFFLMVEGGRIDHALHETTAKKALQDTVAFNDAIKMGIDEMKKIDPELKNTIIVVTADHDHTLVLNGYAKRTGKTTSTNAGVLGLVKNYTDGNPSLDSDGMPYTIIGFGNGENRVNNARSAVAALTDDMTSGNTYHQEAAIRMPAGSETHGGTDVFLGATGMGAEAFHGVMDNTNVFSLIRSASGL